MQLPSGQGIGTEIARRRQEFGFSQVELAELSDLPTDRVAAIEGGHVASTWELTALADALGTEPAALWRLEQGLDAKRSVARFRAPRGIDSLGPTEARLLARAAEAGRICAWLRTLLQKPVTGLQDARKVCAVKPQPEPWRQGYDLGRVARESLAPEARRLPSVEDLLEELGVHIARVRFESPSIEAVSLHEPNACPVILLNSKAPRVRYPLARRAILAHELCHILHDAGERDLLTVVSRDCESSPSEQRANGFAPSFLAPEPWVRVRAEEPAAIALEIAEAWGLSFEGAAWHAKNLGLVSPDVAERLVTKKRSVVVDVEQDIPRTPPDMVGLRPDVSPIADGTLSEIAILAYEGASISRQRAEEILDLR